MSRPLFLLVPLSVVIATSACGGARPAPGGAPQPQPAATSNAPAGPPSSAQPAANGPCPYLTTDFVAEANGQHVGKVKVSDDKPHPACFFYRPDGSQQMYVQVYLGGAASAKALVDQVAPTATSSPATVTGGWSGGSRGGDGDTGAVFAVAKAGTAVVAATNQKQSFKAKRVVEQTISALGL